MSRINEIVDNIIEIEKSFIRSDIEKAWKSLPIGTIQTRKDGRKYKKVSETGNSAKDWQLVTKDKNNTKEDTKERIPNDKQGNSKVKPEELKEHAKNTSEQALQNAIKQSSDPKIRQIAHEEIDRREKEEKVQEKNKGDLLDPKKVKEQFDNTDFVEKFRQLLDDQIKFYLDAPYQKVKEAAKIVADERGLSVVSKEDYIKSFEDFDLSDDFDKKQEEHHAKFKSSILKDKTEEQRQKIFDEEESSLQNLEELKKKAKEQIIKAKSLYEDDSKIIKGLLSLPSNKDLSDALNLYKSFDFDLIRKYLSTGNVDSEKYKSILDKRVDLISNFIQENKIKDNITLYRMVSDSRSNPFFSKLKEGDIYEDKSFSSTSLRKLQFFGDFKIKILAKKGSNVANIDNPGELEYLVDKNSKFRVIEKHENGLGITVELL